MPNEVLTNIYANYGMLGLIVIAFFALLIWVIKSTVKREEKLYSIIETLSNELPEIRMQLQCIQETLGASNNIRQGRK